MLDSLNFSEGGDKLLKKYSLHY